MLAVSSIRKFMLTEPLSFRHGFAVPPPSQREVFFAAAREEAGDADCYGCKQPRNDRLGGFDIKRSCPRLGTAQLVKKVLTDFFDKLLSKLQNRNKEDYFAILPAAAGLWNVKGNPDGSLSHFSSLRNLSLGSSLTA